MAKLIFLLVFECLAPKMAKTILANTNVDVLARKFKYLDLKTSKQVVKWDFLVIFKYCVLPGKMLRLAALMASIRGHKRLTVKERPLPQRAQPFHRRHSQMSLRITVFHFLLLFLTLFWSFVLPIAAFLCFGDEQVQEVTCLLQCTLLHSTQSNELVWV